MLVLLFWSTLSAAAETGGRLQSNFRLGIQCEGGCPWLNFEDSLIWQPHLRSSPSPNVRLRIEPQLRVYASPLLTDIDESQSQYALQPFDLQPVVLSLSHQAAYWKNTVGYQRMAWGVGTGMRVLDNINPFDLRDPTRFDQRLSVPMWRSQITWQKAGVDFAFVPIHTPARLPRTTVSLLPDANTLFDAGEDAPPLDIRDARGSILAPDRTLPNSQTAVRGFWLGRRTDIGLSWFHGFDSLPQADGTFMLTGFQTDSDRVDVGIPLTYPKLDIVGLDLKTQLPASILAWAEFGLFLPAQTTVTASESQLNALVTLGALDAVPDPLPVVDTQDGEPYLRWIVGAERLIGPVYLNLQWLHGFPTERCNDELKDYGLWLVHYNPIPELRLESSGATDAEGIWLSGGILAILDDSWEIGVHGIWIEGPNTSSLAFLSDASQVRLQVGTSY